ncbi:hypothetical protein Bca4012_026839 [Brassica carinata]
MPVDFSVLAVVAICCCEYLVMKWTDREERECVPGDDCEAIVDGYNYELVEQVDENDVQEEACVFELKKKLVKYLHTFEMSQGMMEETMMREEMRTVGKKIIFMILYRLIYRLMMNKRMPEGKLERTKHQATRYDVKLYMSSTEVWCCLLGD